MIISDIIPLLIEYLKTQCLENFNKTLSNLKIDDSAKNIKFSEDKYCRNLIFRNDEFEIFLIGWLPKQNTIFHNHPINGCLMKILSGTLVEHIKIDKTINSFTRNINECSYIHDTIGKHKIENISEIPAISLHIYSPPLFYD